MTTSPSASDSFDDKPRWLTATEAADMAGVSYNTIVNWVNAGRLHPQKQMRRLPNGHHREIKVFNLAELLKFIRRRGPDEHGEVAARAFELFQEGRQLREVVIALRQTPERIEQLHDQWVDSGGSELVITPVAKRELERLLGPFVGVADVVERVAALVKKAASEGQQP